MKPKRKNIRWQGYDYSRNGLYFLTIVVQNRLHLFGHVENGEMVLNNAGRMIEKWYREIENKYPDKRCHEMVVMPNHSHGIIEISEMNADDTGMLDDHDRATDANNEPATNAHRCAIDANERKINAHNKRETDAHNGRATDVRDQRASGAHVGAPLRGRPDSTECRRTESPQSNNKYGMHHPKYGATIGEVMDWFKTMTTNEYIRGVKNNGWKRFDRKLWQRNYHDRIIRDWEEYVRIATYILENPSKWNEDKLFTCLP